MILIAILSWCVPHLRAFGVQAIASTSVIAKFAKPVGQMRFQPFGGDF